jgi:hypothetical protein
MDIGVRPTPAMHTILTGKDLIGIGIMGKDYLSSAWMIYILITPAAIRTMFMIDLNTHCPLRLYRIGGAGNDRITHALHQHADSEQKTADFFLSSLHNISSFYVDDNGG